MTTLFWRKAGSVELSAALAAVPFASTPIGLVSTTSLHGFVCVDNAELRRDGTPIDALTVFDGRFFGAEELELRWLHQAGGRGDAVVLGEDEAAVRAAGSSFGNLDSTDVRETIDHTQLVWGTPGRGGNPGHGWTSVREHRTGAIPVPLATPPPTSVHRIGLRLREYVVADDFGNAYVFDELLRGLDWLGPRRLQTADDKAFVVDAGAYTRSEEGEGR